MNIDGRQVKTFAILDFIFSSIVLRFEKDERIIPFGVGKRYCLGEVLARNEIFLFVVNLVQKLKFLPTEKYGHPDTEDFNANLTNIPNDFWIRIKQI